MKVVLYIATLVAVESSFLTCLFGLDQPNVCTQTSGLLQSSWAQLHLQGLA